MQQCFRTTLEHLNKRKDLVMNSNPDEIVPGYKWYLSCVNCGMHPRTAANLARSGFQHTKRVCKRHQSLTLEEKTELVRVDFINTVTSESISDAEYRTWISFFMFLTGSQETLDKAREIASTEAFHKSRSMCCKHGQLR